MPEPLTPHQRAEQALRAIDTLSEGRAATDEQWAEVLKQPNVLPSLEIVAAAIEAGAKPAVSASSRERAIEVMREVYNEAEDDSLSKEEFAVTYLVHSATDKVAAMFATRIAEAIESAVQQEREAFEAHLSSAIDMHRHRRSSPLSNEDTTADAIQKIKVLEKQLQWLRSRFTSPVSADNKETNKGD